MSFLDNEKYKVCKTFDRSKKNYVFFENESIEIWENSPRNQPNPGYSFRYGFARMIHKSADTFPQVADTFPGVLVVRIVERRLYLAYKQKTVIKKSLWIENYRGEKLNT